MLETTGSMNYFDMVALKRARTLIEWKIESTEDEYYQTGNGYISSIGESSPVGDYSTFGGVITGVGAPTTTAVPSPFLLNTYPAVAGYSLRKLRSAETYGVRVKRSSDSAETDVELYDDGSIIDTSSTVSAGGTLSSWLSGATAYVVTWYDQSGNGYDLINIAGNITLSSTGLFLQDATNCYMQVSSATLTQSSPYTFYQALHAGAISNFDYFMSGTNIYSRLLQGSNSTQIEWRANTVVRWTVKTLGNTKTLFTGKANGASSSLWVDNTEYAGNVGSDSLEGLRIGASDSARVGPITHYELILMNGADSASKISDIQSDMNSAYTIY
jgi:hypothetical protein